MGVFFDYDGYDGTNTWIDPQHWKFSTNTTFEANRIETKKVDKRAEEQENLHKIQEETRKREQRRRR